MSRRYWKSILLISFIFLTILFIIGEITFPSILLLPNTQTAAVADFDSNLILHYTFDDGSATDSSGRGNNGTLVGSLTAVMGKFGQALQFNGTSDYITTGKNIVTSYPHSVCVWANLTNKGSWWHYFFSQAEVQFYMREVGGTYYLQYYNNSNAITYTIPSSPYGSWHLYCAAIDADRTAYLFMDGAQAAGPITLSDVSFRHNMSIGASGTSFVAGVLDEVRIYDKALSVQEITALYNQTGPAPTQPSDLSLSPSTLPPDTQTPSPVTVDTTPVTPPVQTQSNGNVQLLASSGSVANTFSTIQACANIVVAGQTCLVGSGVYDERVMPASSGSIGASVTFKSSGGAKVRGFTATGKSYLVIDGFEVTDVGMSYDPEYHGSIRVSGGTGVVISSNYVHDTTSNCIGLSDETFLDVRGNRLDRCAVAKDIIGNPGGPYTIIAGVNDQIRFTLNNQTTYTITLTPGVGRTSAQICTDVNAVTDVPVVVSTKAVHCNGVGADGRIHIYPYWLGPHTSVTLNVVSNNAYATLGLMIGAEVSIGHAAAVTVFGNNQVSSDILIENNQMSRVGDYLNPGGSRFVFRNNIMGPSDPATGLHIDGVQSNSVENFMLIENNQSVDNVSSDNHFLLTSANSNNWIVRFNSTLRSKGGQAWGCASCGAIHNWAHYNNTWYDTNTYSRAWEQLGTTNSTANISRNNIWYRAIIDYIKSEPYYLCAGCSIDRDYDLFFLSGGGSTETHKVSTDPIFQNAGSGDFHLQSSSPAIDAGGSLTVTTNSGSASSQLAVSAAYPFQDGWAGVTPDCIAVGSVSNTSCISSINYTTNTITLRSPLSWKAGDPIYLYSDSSGRRVLYGNAPDIGAYEYPGTGTTPPPQPPQSLSADFNHDGSVNALDFSLLQGSWNQSSTTYDLNHDGIVNTLDYSILIQQWTG